MTLSVFKLSLEDGDDVVDGRFLEVGFLDEHLAGSVEDALGGDEADVLEGVDYPAVDFVFELVEVDVFLEVLLAVAVDVDGVACEHRCELDVEAVLADGERNFFGTEEDFGLLLIFVEAD